MEMKTYHKGDVIFRRGEAAQSMYCITSGHVGIYLDYGTEREKKLADLYSADFFGEMGLIDHAPRSATAVALDRNTELEEITEDTLGTIFREDPSRVLMIIQALSQRLRRLTWDYMELCKTAAAVSESDGKNEEELTETVDELTTRRGMLRYGT